MKPATTVTTITTHAETIVRLAQVAATVWLMMAKTVMTAATTRRAPTNVAIRCGDIQRVDLNVGEPDYEACDDGNDRR